MLITLLVLLPVLKYHIHMLLEKNQYVYCVFIDVS
jgi:hypothetical protein